MCMPTVTQVSWSLRVAKGQEECACHSMPRGARNPRPHRLAAPRRRKPERTLTPSQRRKEALRCLTIELCETEVDALIRRGLLKADARNDRLAVMNALHAHLDGSLGT